jgi:hypothetical protein
MRLVDYWYEADTHWHDGMGLVLTLAGVGMMVWIYWGMMGLYSMSRSDYEGIDA